MTDQSRAHLAKLTGAATTALLGRKNYEGFRSYWPQVADDAGADPPDREFARWLNAVEKVVFSTTLEAADWQNTRLFDDQLPGSSWSLTEMAATDTGAICLFYDYLRPPHA
jgi:dihydrofolate reductase